MQQLVIGSEVQIKFPTGAMQRGKVLVANPTDALVEVPGDLLAKIKIPNKPTSIFMIDGFCATGGMGVEKAAKVLGYKGLKKK